MRKEIKILLWVLLAIFIIYLFIRWNKGYLTFGYIPLLGYQQRKSNLCYNPELPTCVGGKSGVGCYEECNNNK